jgi:hypothetical protein
MHPRRTTVAASSFTASLLRSASGSRAASWLMTWRSRCACCWRAMWLAIRLEYCTSLCRLSTSAIVVGSAPDGFHMCTAKISEFLRGLSSNTASVGVFERMPPSQ